MRYESPTVVVLGPVTAIVRGASNVPADADNETMNDI